MTLELRSWTLVGLLLCLLTARAHAQTATDIPRVYVLDCGQAAFDDAAPLSDTGDMVGKPVQLADPCFLIQHPRGWLLWDAGLAPDVSSGPGFRATPGRPLLAQLAELGLTAADIRFIAFSHLHFDHVGNANLFKQATWILDRRELAWAEHEPGHVSMLPALFSGYRQAHTLHIEGDHDVFGDGTVRILQAPGHTPGSAVLWVALHDSPPIVLSGDLYLQRESRHCHYVPTVNADRAATLASMARVERIVQRTHARLIVQHDVRDFAELPKLPNCLH